MTDPSGHRNSDHDMPLVTIHLGDADHNNPPPYHTNGAPPPYSKTNGETSHTNGSHSNGVTGEVTISIPKEMDGDEGGNGVDKKKTEEKKTEEEKKDAAPRKQVGFFQLFRYATSFDYFLMIVASIAAAANGVTLPAFSLVFGELIDSYAVSPDDMDTQITKFALWLVYIGIASWVLSWLEMGLWMMTGENQAKRIREEFLLSLLRKEQAWLDKQKAGELLNRLSIDTKLVQDAIGDKVAPYIHHNCTFISGLIIGLVKGWQLALIIVGCTPLLAAAGAFMSKMMATYSQEGQLKYAAAGSVAEEVITQIRTVISMGGERREINRYELNLHEATKSGLKKGWTQGFGMGNTWLVVFSTYALALWFGATLIADKKINPSTDEPYTGGDIISVFFAVIMGAFALGNAAPSVPVIASGRGAAYDLFEIIDRPSAIDPMNESGDKPEAPKGEIRFENVSFFYETRPTHRVLNEFSLTITPGQTVALCGSSGCGKSTIVSLLERFYDPVEGKILLDGRPLTNLNVKWWRNQIGLVRQEPVLFSSSIEDNIRYGKPNATREEIEAAAKSANIHDTIVQQPKGYETLVGEDGRMLSGGQKQRVAIARALIRDPLLLILDEATSALDPENELIVQAELDKLMKERKRTTLVIAHRLSTIRNADLIVCMHKGRIVEIGKHDELLEKRGFYYQLVSLQYDNRHQSNSLAPLPLTRKRTESSKKEEEKTLGDLAAEKTNGESSDDKPKPEGEIILTSADLIKSSPAPEEQKEIKEEKKKDEKEKKPAPKAPFGRLLAMTGPDKWWFLVAVIGAIANGGIMPGFSQIFSEMVNTFYLTDPDKMKKDASVWSWIFFAIGVGALLFSLCQWGGIGVVGERLTHRLRLQSFEKLLSMDLSYYDDEENSSGVVLTRLANDAAEVKSLATGPLIQGLQTIALLVCGLVFAFYYGWKLALICLACGPLITAASAAQMKFVAGFSSKAKQAVEKAGEVANESILNMKTVASFSAEDALFKRFSKILEDNKAMGYRTANITGIGFGSSQFILFATYGLAFWYGGRMVHDGEMTFGEVMKVFFAIMMSAMGLGQVAQFAPDSQKANLAATEILKLLDRKSTIDSLSSEGATPSLKNGGNVEFNNIGFCYPARPDIKIFDGFQLNIPANKSIALVGASGSGKSTIIQLLLRFYDVQSGSITIDGEDIRSLNVGKYRSLIGFVQQEPVLFMGTIHENIKYGNPEASDEEVIDAAKAANIHTFIASQAKGYSTMVGQKGFDMSGGQKQRLAIARALLRKPRILLLDEATSALDAESEKLVEEAIHTVSKKCTTITIAHRLTSIKNVDQIVVLSKGKIVEGPASHDQLLKADGEYARMWYAQQKKTNH